MDLGSSAKLAFIMASSLRHSFQEHLTDTDTHKADIWSLWMLGSDSIGCACCLLFCFLFFSSPFLSRQTFNRLAGIGTGDHGRQSIAAAVS